MTWTNDQNKYTTNIYKNKIKEENKNVLQCNDLFVILEEP